MKAVRWHGPKDLRIEELPLPSPPDRGWARVKVMACGICGTDLHDYEHGLPGLSRNPGPRNKLPPLVLGHEFCGIMEALGPETKGPTPGTTVVIDASISCGDCYYCRKGKKMLCTDRGILGRTLDGGFQGYVNVPVENCYPVLAKVPHEVLALAEPLTVAMHAVNRGRFRNGEVALVVGGGAIGLLTAMVLMRRGAGQVGVVEPVAARRKLAEELGVTFTIDPNEGRVIEEVFARASGIGADIVLECVGSAQTYQLSLNLARKQGRIVIVGGSPEPTPINFRDFLRSEKEIIGSFGRFDEWEESISLLGKEPWIWQRLINKLPLEEAPNAFQMLRTQPQGQAGYVKVIIFSA